VEALSTGLAGMYGFIRAGLILLAGIGGAFAAEPTAETRRLAAEIPIADMHLHLIPDLTPDELRTRMDRNKVQWGGAVGRISPRAPAVELFRQALGDRYVVMAGQPDFTAIYYEGGAAALADPANATFKALLDSAEYGLKAGRIRGFGELIVNNRTSHPDQAFRRKFATDAPTLRALFEMANRHKGVIQIHMQPDDDSIAGLERMMAANPDVSVILSHCMVEASPSLVRQLMQKHPQLFCELSARSPPVIPARSPATYQNIFDGYSANSGWIALIESLADRFMVGSDLTHAGVSYDEIIGVIRTGLLPRLPPETMAKVAHGNAVRLFALK